MPPKSISSDDKRTNYLWRSFKFLRPYWRTAASAYAAAIIVNILGIIIPQFIRWIVDEGITRRQTDLLLWGVLGLLGVTLLKSVVSFALGYWSEDASQNVAYDLRNQIYQKLVDLSFAYHDRSETGQLLSRSIQDVERIRFLTGRAVLRLFQATTLFIATLIALLLMNPSLAILALATIPFVGIVSFRFGSHYRPLSRDIQDQVAVLTTRLEQNLRGSRIVKAFAQEEAEIEHFKAANEYWFELSEEAVKLRAQNMPLINLFASLSTVIIIWYGGGLVIDGNLTLGELVAFTTYLGQLVNPIRRFGMIVPAIAMASASGERIFEILDAPNDVEEARDAVVMPPIQGKVEFENVSFTYFGRKRILTDINFSTKPGQVIALLGMTGSGKSTIMNLLPRFYDPSQGVIRIDGVDIRTVTLDSLRDQIGIVLQETTLFADTIRQNIAFGVQDVSEEQIIEVAKSAQAHDFIMQMPQGYATEVGERGITLSGGQKQRIAIARALLKDPRILLLDDAMSSVDTETERHIQVALERLMEGRTSFIIAQRLSTVRMADQVIVLQNGKIAAQGTHTELLNNSGLYAEIYHRQLR